MPALLFASSFFLNPAFTANVPSLCLPDQTLAATVVALDQPFMYNRLGTAEPQGMIFALERDVVPMSGPANGQLQAGNVKLRDDKRPRPIVLRVNVGACLQIHFRNLLDPDLPPQLAHGSNPVNN